MELVQDAGSSEWSVEMVQCPPGFLAAFPFAANYFLETELAETGSKKLLK